MAEGRHEMAFMVGAVIGSVAGAVYGLLNAPQAGWRTRADLSGYAEELGDRLANRVAGVAEEVQMLIGNGPIAPETSSVGFGEPLSGEPYPVEHPDQASSTSSEGVIEP